MSLENNLTYYASGMSDTTLGRTFKVISKYKSTKEFNKKIKGVLYSNDIILLDRYSIDHIIYYDGTNYFINSDVEIAHRFNSNLGIPKEDKKIIDDVINRILNKNILLSDETLLEYDLCTDKIQRKNINNEISRIFDLNINQYIYKVGEYYNIINYHKNIKHNLKVIKSLSL